jgi:hypothetical protein
MIKSVLKLTYFYVNMPLKLKELLYPSSSDLMRLNAEILS